MAGENDANSLSPESKKQKVTNEVIAPLKLNRELFKDHESYEKYLESFGEVKGQVLGLVGHCTDLEKKCDDLIRSEADALKDKVLLQGELDDVKWPARIRNLIFKIEGIFGLEKVDVCYQCAVVTLWHTDQQRCTYDPKTWKFPSIPENQRIFIRYHRWIYFLFTDAKEISEDYRVLNLKQILSQYFNNMKLKLEEERTKTEQCLSNTKDLSNFMTAFCYQIADTCEFCHQRVKECEEVEFDRFGIPNDEFVKMLVKSFGKVRETFPESVFNIDAKEFIPKHLRK